MTSFETKATWKEGIKIIDLKIGDTIYISKIEAGYNYTYECEFEKVERGIVHAKIVNCDRWNLRGGFRNSLYHSTITARKNSCYLWGKGKEDDAWERCHWFNKEGEAK